jgi:hypothetical protein
MRRGLYNAWTQKSLDRLASLKPATYARTEISSGFLGSLERYVYRPPPRAVVTTAGTAAAPDAPPAQGAGTPGRTAVSPPTAQTAGGADAITR